MRTYELRIKNENYSVKVHSVSRKQADLEINGQRITVDLDSVTSVHMAPKQARSATIPASSAAPARAPSGPAASTTSGGGHPVPAPIPGAIMEIFVKTGDEVSQGQPILKMEAMKMENVINAPVSGKVGIINVSPGDAVAQGQELMQID